MARKICYGCMQPKEQSPVCELCGFDERKLNDQNQLPIGTVLQGQYVIGRVLGQGGFGITYIGWDRVLQMPVAIKEYFPVGVVHRDIHYGPEVICNGRDQEIFEKHRNRFLQEARTLAQLTRVPEIVQIKNFFAANNTAYIVMEYVQGITLKSRLKNLGRPMTVHEALQTMEPVIRSLQKVHELQMIHRDISPDNIMLPQTGGIKLIDFGTARNMDDSMRSRSTESILKPGFAPLEQYNTKGNLGTWTDVYAVCATFHYLLTGKLPPDAPTRIEDGEALPLLDQVPDLPPHIRKGLQKGLGIRVADRTQTLKQLYEQLYAVQKKPEPVKEKKKTERKPSAPPGKKESTGTSGKKKRLPLVLAAAAVTLAAVLFLVPRNAQEQSSSGTPAQIQGQQTQDTEAQTRETQPQSPEPETQGYEPGQPEPVGAVPVSLSVIAAEYSPMTAQWWKDFTREFEAAYPNIRLTVDVVSWNDIEIVAKTRIANGTPSDILNIDGFADYQADGLLLPVSRYMSQETQSKFFPRMLEESRVGDEIWAVPDLCTTRALYCNMELLGSLGMEPPSTWQDVQMICELLKAYEPGVYPLGLDMTTDEGYACFAYFALNNGGGFLDAQGNWNLDSWENVEAIRFATTLVKNGLTNPDPVTTSRWDLQDIFLEGKVAMMIGTDSMNRYLRDSNVDFPYEIVPLPTNNQADSVSLAASDRMMVFDNDYSEAELAAITCFFDFFYQDDRYSGWMTVEGFLPATRTGCRYLQQQDPSQAVWSSILENAVFYPVGKQNWLDVRNGIIAVQQEVLLGGNAESLLQDLQRLVEG